MNISSDDRMLPNSMLSYAPRVRGYAKTNAKEYSPKVTTPWISGNAFCTYVFVEV
jgi:hypothetical protein